MSEAGEFCQIKRMRLHRWEKILLMLPLAAAIAATALYLIQGGFGAGHGQFDLAIYLLGLPSILWVDYIWPVSGPSARDWLSVVIVPPAVMNLLLAIGVIGLVRLVRGRSRPRLRG
jgi:hypothetical protein